MSKGKGIPTVLVSAEHFNLVAASAKKLGVTPSTVANLVIQSVIAAAERSIGSNHVEMLKAQDGPASTVVLNPMKLPISTHTKRILSTAAKVFQLSEETIALWSIHEMLPAIERIEPLNRHTLPPALYNRVGQIERGEHGATPS